jgi:hypothetical protein
MIVTQCNEYDGLRTSVPTSKTSGLNSHKIPAKFTTLIRLLKCRVDLTLKTQTGAGDLSDLNEQFVNIVPSEAGNFHFHRSVQTGSGAHPAPYPMGTTGSFPWGKAAGA